MQFGAMNFPIMPVLAEIETIAALGMDYLELAMDPPQAHYRQVLDQKSAIVKTLKANNLSLVCHLPTFIHTADLTESIRKASVDEALRSLETAAELGARKTVLHPGYISGLAIHVKERVLELALDSLATIARRAGQLGIVVCIENLFPHFSPYVCAEDFEPVFRSLPDLKLVLDVGHAFIGDKGGQRWQAFLSRFGDRLEHVHVSDNLGQRDDHLPIGAGTIPYKQVAKALRGIGYDKTMTLEIFVENRSVLVKSRQKIAGLMAQ